MKKNYITPGTEVMQADVEQMLAASICGKIGDNEEIGYGGLDEDGSLDPSVKEHAADYEWDF